MTNVRQFIIESVSARQKNSSQTKTDAYGRIVACMIFSHQRNTSNSVNSEQLNTVVYLR